MELLEPLEAVAPPKRMKAGLSTSVTIPIGKATNPSSLPCFGVCLCELWSLELFCFLLCLLSHLVMSANSLRSEKVHEAGFIGATAESLTVLSRCPTCLTSVRPGVEGGRPAATTCEVTPITEDWPRSDLG